MDKVTAFVKGIFSGKEPLLVTGSGAMVVFFAIPPVLAAFGHPLTHEQVDALAKLVSAIGIVLARRLVTPA